jgi:hypothetical protein
MNIPHHTVTMVLKAAEDLRAPTAGGTYIALFAHSQCKVALARLAFSACQTFSAFLQSVDAFNRDGGLALWKGGEVNGDNRYASRLDTLSSMVNTGRKDLPTAKKMHDRVLAQGGWVWVIMIPVADFSCEFKMMRELAEKYSMEFDNFGRDKNVTKPVKKVKAAAQPYRFVL